MPKIPFDQGYKEAALGGEVPPPFPLCFGEPFSCCAVVSKGQIVKSWNHRLDFHKILLFCQKIVQTLPPSVVLY